MRVTVGSTIQIDNPSEELVRWCKANLVLANPEYSKKLRMHFWLGDTPEYLYLYEVHGQRLILPFGVLRQILPLIEDADVQTSFTDSGTVNYHSTVPLYDYQEAAVDAVAGEFYGILQSPAGSGKTQMGIALIAKLGKRALWLTHTKDLLDQSKTRAERYIDKSLLGTITEGKVELGTGITFATVQTMCNLDLTSYRHYWDLIVVDECHRCAGTPTAVTQFFKVLNSLAARNKYGLSATVHRSDGMIKATYALLGNVIYEVPEDAVQDKVMKVGIRPVGTTTGITADCTNSDGTLNYAALITHLCEDDERCGIIANTIIANRGRPSLILSDRLGHLEKLMTFLPADMRSQAVMISGKMTTKAGKEERRRAIEDMRLGRKKYLFATYSLAKEGLDIPCLERLYLTTPQKDYAVITQSIGRIARTASGKQAPICYDFVDDIRYLYRAYKKRCTTYRKNGCYFVE